MAQKVYDPCITNYKIHLDDSDFVETCSGPPICKIPKRYEHYHPTCTNCKKKTIQFVYDPGFTLPASEIVTNTWLLSTVSRSFAMGVFATIAYGTLRAIVLSYRK
jgi:hypothetical protein